MARKKSVILTYQAEEPAQEKKPMARTKMTPADAKKAAAEAKKAFTAAKKAVAEAQKAFIAAPAKESGAAYRGAVSEHIKAAQALLAAEARA